MKNTQQQVGLFDMDGSLFNYEEQLRSDLKEFNFGEIHDLWTAENENEEIKLRMTEIKARPGWWRNLPKIEAGFQVYELAKSIGFEPYILTKGPDSSPLAWMEKFECCKQWFGENLNVFIVTARKNEDQRKFPCKGLVFGKFLYDDYIPFMKEWLDNRPRGLGIMLESKQNKDFQHPRVVKYNGENLNEVAHAMQCAYNRKHGEPLTLD